MSLKQPVLRASRSTRCILSRVVILSERAGAERLSASRRVPTMPVPPMPHQGILPILPASGFWLKGISYFEQAISVDGRRFADLSPGVQSCSFLVWPEKPFSLVHVFPAALLAALRFALTFLCPRFCCVVVFFVMYR
jgi:hypothetical protein